MAQIALPRHQATQSQSGGVGSPLYQLRKASHVGTVELLPNPDFSFPMRAPEEPQSTRPRPTSLQPQPTARRGAMPHQRLKSVSALPAFSFNPAGTSQPSMSTSPPHSPNSLLATSAKPSHGHRRGGSEFIGGAPTGASLLSSSPTKGDSMLPPPDTALRPGPPSGRRGHAHRRSGAVSAHDLSSMMNPPAVSRADSAPATPSEGNVFVPTHSFNRSISQPSLRDHRSSNDEEARPPSRARVGFSDRIEYIRPLSTISSETETSLSTLRGHSATNSLSSLGGGSGSIPSPQRARVGRQSSFDICKGGEGRPRTAGAVLDKAMDGPVTFNSSDRKRPTSATSPGLSSSGMSAPRTPMKRRGFFRIEPKRSDPSVHTLSCSRSDPALSQYAGSPLPSPTTDDDNDPVEDADRAKSTSRKAGRKPRKVKSWANSIIPRKSKSDKRGKERCSTPRPEVLPDMDDTDTSEDMDFKPNFDDDTTVTIVSVIDPTVRVPKIDTDYTSWQPRALKRVDSDVMSPIIDLDAALGPFNTPSGASPRTQQRGFAAHKRAMFSAGVVTSNHRRTESAPELVPFDMRSSAVVPALPMADVFEEEEPEDEIVMPKKDLEPGHAAKDPEQVEESEVQADAVDGRPADSSAYWDSGQGLGIKHTEEQTNEPHSPCETHPQDDVAKAQQKEPIEVVEDYEEPRTSSLSHASNSTVTSQQLGAQDTKESYPALDMSLSMPPQTLLTPNTVTSSFSSPEYRSSQVSFDTPRIGTAASSVTDYPSLPSPRFGEPGPELRISADDVPSLTSSRSTMTSAMQNAYALASPCRFADRSASLCSDPSELEIRRRKRSSIASLSRLINSSSHSERSKLSIEQRPQSEHLEQTKEKKKINRLSKLMFWKTKDSASASRNSSTAFTHAT